MSRALKFGCSLLLAAALYAQNPKTVRVGVAVMQNTSARPFAGREPRDRLVQFLNLKAKRGQPNIDAIALEATSRGGVASEAAAKQCDFVVFTTLAALHALDRPGEIRIGSDPLPHPPGPPYQNAPVYFALMNFELVRRGEPVLRSTVSSEQRITADDMVAVLMSQVAERVRAEVAKPRVP